ncbi:MAG: hypothetical protein WD069_18880 [Planctomycetales bacterium]
MPVLDPHSDLTTDVIVGIGWIYLILFAMNAIWTVAVFRRGTHHRMPDRFGGQEVPSAGPWALYSALLGMVAIAHFTSAAEPDKFKLRIPQWLMTGIDSLVADPKWYFALSIAGFAAMIVFRKTIVRPTVGWLLLNVSLLFLALSMTDYDFRQIVGKPDNVPIVAMLFIGGFFTWLYFARAVENDERIARGLPVREADKNEKILVWPDLVYTELICMVLITAVLIAWGMALPAPLEEPANASKTPNPSKAPWYFLGLQEMLVYYDPWLAGVVFPSLILGGLMAIPYIDFNKKGSGYYTFEERKFAISTFMFGFIPLWVGMIVLGTFLRGPNWNTFGIYEYWDSHKLEVLNNVNLSEYFWDLLGRPLPGAFLWRESPGIALTLVYLLVLPGLLAATVFRGFYVRMGFLRYMVFSNLLLLMLALVIKMVLRWAIQLKYFVAIPEWFFNI